MRDELVREVADRLDVPVEYVREVRAARPTSPRSTLPAGASAGEVALRADREFLAFCLASGDLGRQYLSIPTPEQFSTDTMRRARDHLASAFEDPLVGLPEDDPTLGALVTDVVHAAQEESAKPESYLRMSVIQLEIRRIGREIKRASHEGNHALQTELAAAEQRAREQLGEVMGQTA